VAHGPVTQAGWLRSLGIVQRAAALKAAAGPQHAHAIDGAVARLTGEGQMGTLFKVLAVTGPDRPAPAGFEGLA
jgi:NADH dehydrogenase [ubiquinone] 1 alpha subcomplex assembly factor 7